MPKELHSSRQWLRKFGLGLSGMLCCVIGGLIAIVWLGVAKNPGDGIGFWAFVVCETCGAGLVLLQIIELSRSVDG